MRRPDAHDVLVVVVALVIALAAGVLVVHAYELATGPVRP